MTRRRFSRWAWVPLGVGLAFGAAGQEPPVDLEAFRRIAILYEGRVMPMDSYAQAILFQFSGKKRLGEAKEPALSWLARTLFTVDPKGDDPLFLINHPEVVEALGIEPRKRRRYSFSELHNSLAKLQELAGRAVQMEEGNRSHVEKELIRVFGNVAYFLQLQSLFLFAVPHADFAVADETLRKEMHLDGGDESRAFIDVFFEAGILQQKVQALGQKPKEEWSANEAEAFRLASVLFAWSRQYRDLQVTFMPIDPHGESVWLSPWDALSINVHDPEMRKALSDLGDMATAYRASARLEFDLAARAYRAFAERRMSNQAARHNLGLEVTANRLNLLSRAGWGYGVAFFVSLLAFLFEGRRLARVSLVLVLVSLAAHAAGIGFRMAIMGRPPVTNLYATFLFVGLICVLLGLFLEAVQRSGLGVLASSFSGLSLLLVAQRFFVEGDTMHQVVAVLDSNFWLSTHVIAITTGYAGCIFAGLIGHIYLLQRIFGPGREGWMAATHRAMIGALAFGLIFSFLGTMLGGVWADHSWGRFWGWDPKENGALLIVLWSALLFHARMGGMISERGMAAGCVLGVIVVLAAWLGVNLLNAGLHSYGFTTGLAGGFFAIVAAEVLFVGITVPIAGRREIKHVASGA
jgi:ABC-type transport system involved in cytochrome c biogenesis permease subunit